jgi:ADP-ribose pyrophosphatase
VSGKKLEKWKTTGSEYLVRADFLKLRVDSCLTPGGHWIERQYVLEFKDWANCFVIDDSGDVVAVRHYRHGAEDYVLELVSGAIEPGEAPIDGMKRELAEEIGYTGGEMYQTGVSYANPATQNNKVHSFLAIGGRCSQPQRLEPGETLFIEKYPFFRFMDIVRDQDAGAIYQSMHMGAVFFALNFIERSSLEALQAFKAHI